MVSVVWVVGAVMAILMGPGCTGSEKPGAQTAAASTPPQAQRQPAPVDARQTIQSINAAIPVYEGADYNGELTRRDATMARTQYGPGTVVYTLATHDSFPQVWHYYVTYLKQFRAFAPVAPYPPSNQIARSIEVKLNEAMRDPFIPGDSLDQSGKQVVLQVAESESGEGSIIRYIVRPEQPQTQAVASAQEPPPASDSSAVR
ncbi:MAG: hypothetical protein ABI718_04235 [Acidobacteriota bacterium]